MGGAFLEAGFAQTGHDVLKWPYSIGIGESQGFRIRYYIDPATLLPAYSIFMATVPVKADGTQNNPQEFPETYFLYEYSYPDQFDQAATQAAGVPQFPYRPWPFPLYVFPQ